MDNLESLNNAYDAHAPKAPLKQRVSRYITEEITEDWADIILLGMCLITGLLDSSVFNVWSCFVSMQTGNTIYSGLGVFGQPQSQPLRWVKSLTSIASFTFGAFAWSRIMRYLGPKKRSTVVFVFLFQSLLILVSALLVQLDVVPEHAGEMLPETFIVLLPLALLAFGQAAQIVVSHVLGYGEVTSVVITSAYCDLFFDEHVLSAGLRENPKRNRRVASAFLLFVGAVLGGYLTQDGDIGLALWIAGAAKAVIGIVWLCWKSQERIRLE